MPYIYTHSEQQRKITVIVICHLRRIWARNGAKAHSLVNLKVQSSQPTLISRRRGGRALCAYPCPQSISC